MKKIIPFTTLLFVASLFAGPAAASERGGFKGPSIEVSTVEQAKQMKDDVPVALRGNIVRHLGKDKYEFRDASGVITVEIDDDVWRGVTVQPSDTVELYGEVDKDWRNVKIDVDAVTKVQ